jgi:hypothetical protein
VLAHELNLGLRPPIVSDAQHTGFRWMRAAELISSPDVHQYTRPIFFEAPLTANIAFCTRMCAAVAAGLESAPIGIITTPGTWAGPILVWAFATTFHARRS